MKCTYIELIATRIGAKCDMKLKGEGRRLLLIYAVLCLSKGAKITNADVHDAWCAWMVDINPVHECLVPFPRLSKKVQALDSIYRDAIKDTASWIFNLPPSRRPRNVLFN